MSKPTPKEFGQAILAEARRFVGLKEVKPNADWTLPANGARGIQLALELRKLMRPSPWQEGWAYCAAFAEAMVIKAASNLKLETRNLSKLLQPGVLNTWRAFDDHVLKLTSDEPCDGAIWLLKHLDKPGQGHAGIVADWTPHNLFTIEANTSNSEASSAKDREGDWIAEKVSDCKGRGRLRTLGFITPEALLMLC